MTIMKLTSQYKVPKSQIMNNWYLEDILDALEYSEIESEFEKQYYANSETERQR